MDQCQSSPGRPFDSRVTGSGQQQGCNLTAALIGLAWPPVAHGCGLLTPTLCGGAQPRASRKRIFSSTAKTRQFICSIWKRSVVATAYYVGVMPPLGEDRCQVDGRGSRSRTLRVEVLIAHSQCAQAHRRRRDVKADSADWSCRSAAAMAGGEPNASALSAAVAAQNSAETARLLNELKGRWLLSGSQLQPLGASPLHQVSAVCRHACIHIRVTSSRSDLGDSLVQS